MSVMRKCAGEQQRSWRAQTPVEERPTTEKKWETLKPLQIPFRNTAQPHRSTMSLAGCGKTPMKTYVERKFACKSLSSRSPKRSKLLPWFFFPQPASASILVKRTEVGATGEGTRLVQRPTVMAKTRIGNRTAISNLP